MSTSPKNKQSRARWARSIAAGTLGLATAAVAAVAAGCGSLPKAKIEDRLLSLEKNAPIRKLGLERLPIEFAPSGAEGPRVELELTYLHVPAARPEPGRRPVVLVHGTPSTLCSWVEVALGGPEFPGLSAERDVYAIEIVGHGMARGSLDDYGFEECARFVGAALEGLGLEAVHLVGSSYGGEFAWRAALNQGARVGSLVLMDSSGYAREEGGFLPEEVAMRENPLAGFGYLLNSSSRITTALEPHFPTIPPGRVDEFYLACANRDNWRAMVELAKDENGTRQAEIARIAQPTLVLWGRDDVAYPLEVYGERFAREIPDARLVILETGHYPHEQSPREVLLALDAFFDSVER